SRRLVYSFSCTAARSRLLFFSWPGAHRALHSFPTRRSSDLAGVGSSVGLLVAPLALDLARTWYTGLDGIDGALIQRLYRVRAKRSEEHTSELQSRENLVCRLLLEKKKKNTTS